MTTKSIYIHIPFCSGKCHYCSFISFADKKEYFGAYKTALIKNIENSFAQNPPEKIDTIYIGGGTPSILEVDFYQEIFQCISNFATIKKNTEITMEINPKTVNTEYFENLKKLGVNRISVGIQCFDDEILKIINRIHNTEEAIETVKQAQRVGFDNISIDLIYGLPHQTLKKLDDTLEKALELDIQHISTYGLKIEDGTYFADNLPKNLPDQDLAADMYLNIVKKLTQNGFEHYEISNFCKKGYESEHNCIYWANQEYYGFGLAAHGYENGVRYSNVQNFEKYLKAKKQKQELHQVTTKEKREESIFLGLRMKKGIDLVQFKNIYGIDLTEKYSLIIQKHLKNNLIVLNDDILQLTPQGFLLSNEVLADFIDM